MSLLDWLPYDLQAEGPPYQNRGLMMCNAHTVILVPGLTNPPYLSSHTIRRAKIMPAGIQLAR
jgi:hypothetical protein